MQQLHPHTGTAKRVAYGMAVRGRLLRTKQAALVAPFEAAFEAVRAGARRVEDLEAEVQYANVARKGVTLSLSREARQLRLRLAARSLDAIKKAPYTAVFPEGLRPLTEAPLREVVVRYAALAQRTEVALAPDDPLREETVARLRAGIRAFREATSQVERARAAMRLARGVRDSAVMDSIEQTWVLYGTLLARVGKEKAEQIMRIPGGGRGRAEGSGSEDPDGSGQGGVGAGSCGSGSVELQGPSAATASPPARREHPSEAARPRGERPDLASSPHDPAESAMIVSRPPRNRPDRTTIPPAAPRSHRPTTTADRLPTERVGALAPWIADWRRSGGRLWRRCGWGGEAQEDPGDETRGARTSTDPRRTSPPLPPALPPEDRLVTSG